MDKKNNEFNIPFYILQEITEYIELTAQGYCKSMKWENIRLLLNLAVLNNRLSKQQAEFIEEKFCRE